MWCVHRVVQHGDSMRALPQPAQRCPIPVRPSLLQPPTATPLPSIPMDLPILDASYEWTHAVCGLLCVASFTWHSASRVHPPGSLSQDTIPFCGQITPSSMFKKSPGSVGSFHQPVCPHPLCQKPENSVPAFSFSFLPVAAEPKRGPGSNAPHSVRRE